MFTEMEELQKQISNFATLTKSMKEIIDQQSTEILLQKEANRKKVDQYQHEMNEEIKRLKQELNDHEIKTKRREVKFISTSSLSYLMRGEFRRRTWGIWNRK